MIRLRAMAALLCACSVAPRLAHAVVVGDFIDFSLRDAANQVLLPGRLYVPPASLVPSAAPRPFITFLHGAAYNGFDNLAQLAGVNDHLLAEAKQRGAFLYVPQAPGTWITPIVTDRVMTMIDRAISELHADGNREYLMGHSQGSHGTWTMLSRYDGRFAAAIPMSGGNPATDFAAGRLVDDAILALHSRDDATAPVAGTRALLSSILASAHERQPTYLAASNPSTFILSNATAPFHAEFRTLVHQLGSATDFLVTNPALDLLYYEPATGGHNGPLGALNAPQLYEWLFSHTAVVPEPHAGLTAAIAVAGVAHRFRVKSSTGRRRRDACRKRLRTRRPGSVANATIPAAA